MNPLDPHPVCPCNDVALGRHGRYTKDLGSPIPKSFDLSKAKKSTEHDDSCEMIEIAQRFQLFHKSLQNIRRD